MKPPEPPQVRSLLQWAELAQVGAHTLARWILYVSDGVVVGEEGGPRQVAPCLVLPIATTKYSHGYWEIRPKQQRPSDEDVERHAMLRAGGAHVRVGHRWDEVANDMLRYLEQGPFTVIVRARP